MDFGVPVVCWVTTVSLLLSNPYMHVWLWPYLCLCRVVACVCVSACMHMASPCACRLPGWEMAALGGAAVWKWDKDVWFIGSDRKSILCNVYNPAITTQPNERTIIQSFTPYLPEADSRLKGKVHGVVMEAAKRPIRVRLWRSLELTERKTVRKARMDCPLGRCMSTGAGMLLLCALCEVKGHPLLIIKTPLIYE